MKPRRYQIMAIENVLDAFKTHRSCLIVQPTGTGKTVTFCTIADRMDHARVLIVAHREELIWQAADKVKKITGEEPGIEMAEYRADKISLYGKQRVVVASIPTLNAGLKMPDGTKKPRMECFDHNDFGLVIIDEAHHATARTYRKVIKHFAQNPNCRILGVTATPDRADEEALGQIFEHVAYEYDIVDAINDGWLVPLAVRSVVVQDLDLSAVRTTAGDLNGADLARVMEYEQCLHEVASPVWEMTQNKKVLVFAASVPHAERLSEIFNRYEPNVARWLCGETDKVIRRQMLAEYAARKFRILVNVGVATEGFDDPGIETVVIARPTKSRALYAQMVGRGLRPLPGIVDAIVDEDDDLFGAEYPSVLRRKAIASSSKPVCEIIDMVGNSGNHRLVNAADILGGKRSSDVVARAAKKLAEEGKPRDVQQVMEEVEDEIKKEAEAEKRWEEARRARLRLKAQYSVEKVDPFSVFGIQPWQERGWNKGRPATPGQIAFLEKVGVENPEKMNFTQASQVITECKERWDKGLCTYKQARILAKNGLPTDVSKEEASRTLDDIFAGRRRERFAHRQNQDSEELAGITRY